MFMLISLVYHDEFSGRGRPLARTWEDRGGGPCHAPPATRSQCERQAQAPSRISPDRPRKWERISRSKIRVQNKSTREIFLARPRNAGHNLYSANPSRSISVA